MVFMVAFIVALLKATHLMVVLLVVLLVSRRNSAEDNFVFEADDGVNMFIFFVVEAFYSDRIAGAVYSD